MRARAASRVRSLLPSAPPPQWSGSLPVSASWSVMPFDSCQVTSGIERGATGRSRSSATSSTCLRSLSWRWRVGGNLRSSSLLPNGWVVRCVRRRAMPCCHTPPLERAQVGHLGFMRPWTRPGPSSVPWLSVRPSISGRGTARALRCWSFRLCCPWPCCCLRVHSFQPLSTSKSLSPFASPARYRPNSGFSRSPQRS